MTLCIMKLQWTLNNVHDEMSVIHLAIVIHIERKGKDVFNHSLRKWDCTHCVHWVAKKDHPFPSHHPSQSKLPDEILPQGCCC